MFELKSLTSAYLCSMFDKSAIAAWFPGNPSWPWTTDVTLGLMPMDTQ